MRGVGLRLLGDAYTTKKKGSMRPSLPRHLRIIRRVDLFEMIGNGIEIIQRDGSQHVEFLKRPIAAEFFVLPLLLLLIIAGDLG